MTQTVSTIDFTGQYLGNSGRRDKVAAACEGTLRFREVGNYEICTSSDDGSKVYFDGRLWLDNGGLHAVVYKCRSIYISSPTSKATVVDFFEHGGGLELRMWWTTPSNCGRVIIPASAWMPELPTLSPTQELPTLSPNQFYASGILVYYYNFAATSLPFGGLLNSSYQHYMTQTVSTIDFTGQYLGNSGRRDKVAAACEGTLRFREVGNYEICTSSDDGSKVYFDGRLWLDNGGLHAVVYKCRSIYISSPTSKATVVDFFEHGGGLELRMWWTTPSNCGRVIIPASAWMP